MTGKSKIVALIAAALVVVMGVLGVTVLPARASADQSDWTPTHATDEQLKGMLCHANDPVGDGTYVRYYFRAEQDPNAAQPTITLDDGRTLAGYYDYDNNVYLGATKVSKVVFKDYVKPNHIDFRYLPRNNSNVADNTYLTSIEGLDKLDTSAVEDMDSAFERCTALQSIDLSHFDTSKVGTMEEMFKSCTSLKNIDISRLDMSACWNTKNMFYGCSSLESTNIANSSTSNLKNMSGMLENCSKLHDLSFDGLDTSSVKDMSYVFDGCTSLESLDLSVLNTSKVTSMAGLVDSCKGLKSINLEGVNTSAVTNMRGMFSDCSSLESLDISGLDTSNVTDMGYMLCGLSLPTIDVSNLNTANVTNMDNMFSRSDVLENVDLSHFDTSKVTNMEEMFYDCKELKSVDVSHLDTSKVTKVGWMFRDCPKLQSIDVSNFDLGNAKSARYMFLNCSSLKRVDLSRSKVSDINAEEMFSGCSSLESVNLFSGTCTDINRMFEQCGSLKTLDISMLSRSSSESFHFGFVIIGSGVEQIRTRGDLFSIDYSNWNSLPLSGSLKKITIVANSGDLSVLDFSTSATTTMSGKNAVHGSMFGKESETADNVVSPKNRKLTLTGGAEDTSWYLQALTHEVRFYVGGRKPVAAYKVFDGEPFNEEVPGTPESLPPFMTIARWDANVEDEDSGITSKKSLEELRASGELSHITRDLDFDAVIEWKDRDGEHHPNNSYVVRVPSKISYKHQRIGAVDISTAYDVSVAGYFEYASPDEEVELTAVLNGFDGLSASVSDSDNGDTSSRLIGMMELSNSSDDGKFIAGKQFKDILHLSGSVNSAKTITGHITYSCKPYDPEPEPYDPGEGGVR